MSSAMHRNRLKTSGPTDAAGEDLDRFYANLSLCLHAMGQPLTILRCAAAASVAPGITEENLRRYLKNSAEHAEVVCGLYHCLRDFVDTSMCAARCAPLEFSELFSSVVEDERAALQASGVAIEVTMPDGPQPILADIDRTSQAVGAVLKVAGSVSLAGEVIELLVTPRNGEVELTVQNRRARARQLNSRQHLDLALAEAKIRSQQGEFECAEDRFCVSLTIPVAEFDALGSEDAPVRAYAHVLD